MDTSVLPLRQRSLLRDEWLKERLGTVVPTIMKRAGIDCWVLVAREYNEDPVVSTMLPSTWLNARRRTILVFTAYGAERIAISRYAVGAAFPAGWSPDEEPNQWQRLADYLEETNPQRIAVNRSPVFALGDGFSSTEYEAFRDVLPAQLQQRVESTADLAVGWLETRTPAEMEYYPDVCRRAHAILRRALSAEVVSAGVTTTADVEWWLRQQVTAQGYESWFHPTVSVQRSVGGELEGFAARPDDVTILHGDLIHIDFGIIYLGLHTDQQQHAYVLAPGENRAPAGLVAALESANLLQDILTGEFQPGRTGNEILARARKAATAAGINATIYSHPIGLHGHAAGPTIGLWDQQDGVPGSGDYPVWPDTAYSIELSATSQIAEWNDQTVRIMLEEDAFFDGERLQFLDGRQTEFWLI